ncbi:MAG: hypothetical protein ACLP5H_10980 [Desulfomonilaceae bacterium]
MLIKDLFNEIVRRLEWSKERNLEPYFTQGPSKCVATLPVDKSLAYVVTLDEIVGRGVLIKSFFPDGEPHHCIGIPDVDLEEVASIINAAALIVYRRPLRRKEEKTT